MTLTKYSVIMIKAGVGKESYDGLLPTGVKIWLDRFQKSIAYDTMIIEKEKKK